MSLRSSLQIHSLWVTLYSRSLKFLLTVSDMFEVHDDLLNFMRIICLHAINLKKLGLKFSQAFISMKQRRQGLNLSSGNFML